MLESAHRRSHSACNPTISSFPLILAQRNLKHSIHVLFESLRPVFRYPDFPLHFSLKKDILKKRRAVSKITVNVLKASCVDPIDRHAMLFFLSYCLHLRIRSRLHLFQTCCHPLKKANQIETPCINRLDIRGPDLLWAANMRRCR